MTYLHMFRVKPLASKFISFQLQSRYFSPSILNPDSTTPLSSKEKSRAALFLLKSVKNPNMGCLVVPAIVLYGKAGMSGDAVKVFDKMPELGTRRTVGTLNALLYSFNVAKNYSEVKRVFVEFPKKYRIKPNLITYNTVIKSFCESGSSSSVYSVLDEMNIRRCKPDLKTFWTWMSGFYKEKKFKDVVKVLGSMHDHNLFPGITTYNIRIKELCKLSRSGEAKALVDAMFSCGVKPNKVTYYHLIHGFCKEGKMYEAKHLYMKMKNAGFKPDSDCYFTLIYFLCKRGDFETALSICKEGLAKRWIPSYTVIVDGLASISNADDALELVAQMKVKFPNQLNEI